MGYKNAEGYYDPTAGNAMANMKREIRANKREQQRRRRNGRNFTMIYVASKYAGNTEKNLKTAISCCQYVIMKGKIPVASHIMYAGSHMLRDDVPEERALGLYFGQKLLSLCDELWAFGEISHGMELEIKEANRLGIPVRYLEVPR